MKPLMLRKLLPPTVSIVLTVALLLIGAAPTSAQVDVGVLDFRDYDLDDMGISRPASITYAPDSGFLFVGYAGTDSPTRIFTITPYEAFIDVFDLPDGSFTPNTIAYDPHTARLLIYDAAAQQLIALETEPNGQIDSTAEAVRYDMAGLGLLDAQGMVVSLAAPRLYLLDNATRTVIQIEADTNGNYAVVGDGGDRVSRIGLDVPDTASLRGLAQDGQSGHFYTLDARTMLLYKLDAAGQMALTYDLSQVGLANPSGLVSAPSADATDDPSIVDLYLTDSGQPPSDGRMIELYLKSLPASFAGTEAINQLPAVDAGADQTLTGTLTTTLNGAVSDDGLPVPPGAVTAFWGTLSGPGWATFADGRALDTTVTFPAYGTYTLGLFATDGGLGSFGLDEVVITLVEGGSSPDVDAVPNLVVTPAAVDAQAGVTVTAPVTPTATVTSTPTVIATPTVIVAAGAPQGSVVVERLITDDWDDVEERAQGTVSNNNDLELVFDNDGNQRVGLRFNDIDIPQGAVIDSAFVQFTVDEASTEPTQLTIYGERSADAAKFDDSADFDVSNRPATAASVPWTPDAWSTPGEAGPAQRTPDLAAIIQELVNLPQWKSGNSLVLVISGTGERVAQAFDLDPAKAPLLHIEYHPAPSVE